MGISKSTLLRRMRRGADIPRVVKLDERTWRWRAVDIEQGLQRRAVGDSDATDGDGSDSGGE